MTMRPMLGDVLDSKDDAIILTIEGEAKGMEGAVARQFARRWPEAWAEIQDEVRYPITLGNIFEHEPTAVCPYRLVIIAATLHHKDNLNEQAKKGVVRSALETAIETATAYGGKSIATTIMKGGWRLKEEVAFLAMSEACESAFQKHPKVELLVYIQNEAMYERMQGLALSLGWRTSH